MSEVIVSQEQDGPWPSSFTMAAGDNKVKFKCKDSDTVTVSVDAKVTGFQLNSSNSQNEVKYKYTGTTPKRFDLESPANTEEQMGGSTTLKIKGG